MVENRPEGSIQGVPRWPRPFAFEDGDLLPEGEDFEGSIASTAEEDADGEDEFEHELTVVTWRNVASAG